MTKIILEMALYATYTILGAVILVFGTRLVTLAVIKQVQECRRKTADKKMDALVRLFSIVKLHSKELSDYSEQCVLWIDDEESDLSTIPNVTFLTKEEKKAITDSLLDLFM